MEKEPKNLMSRRQAKRIPFNGMLSYWPFSWLKMHAEEGQAENISKTGIMFHVKEDFKLRDKLKIEIPFTFEGKEEVLLAVVEIRWISSRADDNTRKIGTQFIDLTGPQREQIQKLIGTLRRKQT